MHGGYRIAHPIAGSLARSTRHALIALGVLAVLAGCGTRGSRAPVTDMSSAGPSQPAATGTYTVRAGDTLYKIAQAHGTDVSRLIRLNKISDPTQLRIGQVLRLDGDTPLPQQPPAVAATPSTAPVATPVTPPPAPTASRASDANLISWGWPASGKIIQSFNNNTKGIDIEGTPGDPVIAAADGTVMYAGNGVRGLGNLVLLGHSDGFITAYAHNQELLVKTGDTIKKGARIALLGQTDTTSPRLHFEIRRRGTPVNPLSYLPPR